MLALLRRSPLEGRKKEAKLQALSVALSNAFSTNPNAARSQIKREVLQSLALQVTGLWRRAHKIRNVSIVQHLSCFNGGNITYGPSGELQGPKDSFNCLKTERCAAAAYLSDSKVNLRKMIDALHPNKLDSAIAGKNETKKRRRALKDLLNRGPAEFDKGKCRALGDAYFAAMCPLDSEVLTTNLSDHLPICEAVGKRAVAP